MDEIISNVILSRIKRDMTGACAKQCVEFESNWIIASAFSQNTRGTNHPIRIKYDNFYL